MHLYRLTLSPHTQFCLSCASEVGGGLCCPSSGAISASVTLQDLRTQPSVPWPFSEVAMKSRQDGLHHDASGNSARDRCNGFCLNRPKRLEAMVQANEEAFKIWGSSSPPRLQFSGCSLVNPSLATEAKTCLANEPIVTLVLHLCFGTRWS